MKTVAVLVGSLRRDSINRKFAEALEKLAEGKLKFDYVDLDMPLYNEDLWENPPAAVTEMKRIVDAADGVLVLTPEYNRFMSPAVKNAIDWGSRPYGKGSWSGKPAAGIGATPGALGALAGIMSLITLMGAVGMTVMTQPGVYMSLRDSSFDAEGGIADEGARKFLQGFVDAFADWVDTKA
ncbi:NADPH-dependent FMN reductase [Mangrovicoccus ximenensis]|uniref:NADPH-dependent FMN reductase n=1 Tax=Mangrovicoccus ximenensis TaxID=1911570 RepID=UPI000D3AC3CB|nr:NAD(P)H-dependent oxidoreductase [Mangrovicoccus ximenensis]